MKIFVINGTGGSGKDTFIEIFKRKYHDKGTVINISTVDTIKEAAKCFFFWDGKKDEKSRKFLSDLKDLVTNYSDAPFKYIKGTIELWSDSNDAIIFIHCREPEEIERLVKNFNAQTILIDARERVPAINSNHADSDVYEYAYDYIIDNNGSRKQLECAVECFLEMIEEKSSLS